MDNIDITDTTRKIVIAGTGRCGTSFLVQLLTSLGFPTGISHTEGRWLMTNFQEVLAESACGLALRVNRIAPPGWFPRVCGMRGGNRAGLEHHVMYTDTVESLAALPKVIKNPRLAVMLNRLLREDRIRLDYVLVCVRDLDAVASSKIESGKCSPEEQYYRRSARELRSISAAQLGELTATLIGYDVSHSFIAFPRMVDDPEYLFNCLTPLLPPAISLDMFKAAHSRLARRDFVHHREQSDKEITNILTG
jgi:hypothetical protein